MIDKREPADYYQQVEAGYDRLAPSYDEDIGANLIGTRMRQVFRKALLRVFKPGQRVFEIGCGTGIDALFLARHGLDVVATDISREMVEQVLQKAKRAGL